MSNLKKIISIFLIVLGLVILFSVYYSSNSKKSNVFSGSIQSMDEDNLLVHGAFDDEVKSAEPLYEYTVKVDNNTKLTKNSFVKPVGGEMFEIDKIPKEKTEVSLDVFQKDSKNVAIGLYITLKRDLFGRVTNRASEITYIAPKY